MKSHVQLSTQIQKLLSSTIGIEAYERTYILPRQTAFVSVSVYAVQMSHVKYRYLFCIPFQYTVLAELTVLHE